MLNKLLNLLGITSGRGSLVRAVQSLLKVPYIIYPVAFHTVDIIPYRKTKNGLELLLGRKHNSNSFQFCGGFVEPMQTAEGAAKRELEEESFIVIEETDLKYIGSYFIDDSRYKNSCHKITTSLFMVDVTDGVTQFDKDVANIVRRSKKPVLLVVNKVDNSERNSYAGEFYELGLGDPFCISSNSGAGTGDLMDALVKTFPEDLGAIEDSHLPKIAIVGRPNVGKSSLTNALLGEDRNIVTAIAGTTRDTIHTRYNKFGHDFLLIDTAGMRKKAKVHEDIEFYSVMRTINAI